MKLRHRSVLVAGGLLTAVLPLGSPFAIAATSPTLPPVDLAATQAAPLAAETTVASIKAGSISIYQAASTAGKSKVLTSGKEIKGRVVFQVIERQGAWFKVKVPARPNGAVGFVRATDVDTYTHPYNIVIELKARRLHLFKAGALLSSVPVAVGTAKTPTPQGKFFTADLIRPTQGPNGPYGPYAYGISGFSATIFKFGAGGDGRVGIHGTNQPGLIGQAVTNGCIRMTNDNILKLRGILPLGVPVEIRI